MSNPYTQLAVAKILGNGSPIELMQSCTKSKAVGFAIISPEQAAKLVESRMSYAVRRQYDNKIREYRASMDAGNWSEDCSLSFVVIRGSEDQWCVANGNHRLAALAGAKVPGLDVQVTIHLVNTKAELQRLVNGMDVLKPRSNADKLMIGGFGHLPDLKLLGGCLGALRYGFTFSQSSMEHNDIVTSAKSWEPFYVAYMETITGDIPEIAAIPTFHQDAMAAKLRTNVVASVGMVTFSNTDPEIVEMAKRFWRGLRTLDANGDDRLQVYIRVAQELFHQLNQSKSSGKNPLRTETGRAKLFRQMCAMWNDWVAGAAKPRSMTAIEASDFPAISATNLDGSTNKAWSSIKQDWVQV